MAPLRQPAAKTTGGKGKGRPALAGPAGKGLGKTGLKRHRRVT
jgi:hypothetical protein